MSGKSLHVTADNCTDTLDALKSVDLRFEVTANGNAGTCRYIFGKVVNRYAPEDFLYLLEDDHLNFPGSRQALFFRHGKHALAHNRFNDDDFCRAS